MGFRSLAPVALLAAIWGSSYLFIDIALRSFDPAVVAFSRQALGAMCLAPIALRRGALRLPEGSLGWLVVISVTMVGGPTLLVALGQQTVSSSLAGILIATTPVLTAALALRLAPTDAATPRQLFGVALGMLGIVSLFGLDLGDSRGALLGGAALLLASLGYALGGFLVQRHAQDVPPLGLVVYGSAISAVLLLPLAVPRLASTHPDIGHAAALVELGVVGTAAGWLLYYRLIQTAGPQRASLVQYIAPAFSVVLGALILSDPVGVSTVLGLTMVLSGSWLAARSPRPARDHVPPTPS